MYSSLHVLSMVLTFSIDVIQDGYQARLYMYRCELATTRDHMCTAGLLFVQMSVPSMSIQHALHNAG